MNIATKPYIIGNHKGELFFTNISENSTKKVRSFIRTEDEKNKTISFDVNFLIRIYTVKKRKLPQYSPPEVPFFIIFK